MNIILNKSIGHKLCETISGYFSALIVHNSYIVVYRTNNCIAHSRFVNKINKIHMVHEINIVRQDDTSMYVVCPNLEYTHQPHLHSSLDEHSRTHHSGTWVGCQSSYHWYNSWYAQHQHKKLQNVILLIMEIQNGHTKSVLLRVLRPPYLLVNI